LMVGQPIQLAGRSAIHIAAATPPMPLAAIATTIATGVSPLVHGVVTAVTVDAKNLESREVVASDRRFQAFWAQSGLRVSLINWPATKGDSDVSTVLSDAVFATAKKLQRSDIVGIVMPSDVQEKSTPVKVYEQQAKLETYLATLSNETNVLLVYKRTNEDGNIVPKAVHTFGATLLIEGAEYESSRSSFIEYFGGVIFALAGIPVPVGVKVPNWPFMHAFNQYDARSFPSLPPQDDTDWIQLIDKVVASKNKQSISILTQRFLTFMSVAYKKRHWKELSSSSACLIKLRGKRLEYWQHILAAHQLGEQEQLVDAVDALTKIHPKALITAIAKSLLLFQSKPEEAKDLLQNVDPAKIGVYHSLGTLGRVCLRVGLEEKGISAIELAMQKRTVIPADRARLARFYVEQDNYLKALNVLGTTGIGGDISWQVLRMQILVELKKPELAKQIAFNILNKKPSHVEALRVIG
ncbi:MAG: hypothetical protein P8N28_00855, partial [Phycisphaerales bacterium]|nr:hypothetical protein [Phycisphaerales bacterium]